MSQRLEFWIPLTPGADAASPARSWSWTACVTQPLVPLSKPGRGTAGTLSRVAQPLLQGWRWPAWPAPTLF